MIIVIVLVWIVCTILAHGILFAYCQRHDTKFAKKNYWDDFIGSLIASFICGPVTLIIVLGLLIFLEEGTLKHGLKFW